jgi:hypothetical protein
MSAMNIYSPITNYRKIYEKHYGPIPKENDGRSYEIHHIDGNHSNNEPSNLIAVTLREHYNIHLRQGDHAAAILLGAKLKISAVEISNIAKANAQRRVENGTHPFIGGEIQRISQNKRVTDGIHPWIGNGELQRNIQLNKVKEGRHQFSGSENNQKRINNGSHNFLDRDAATKRNLKRIADGIHTSQIKVCCVGCAKIISSNNLKNHTKNCKAYSE